VVLDPFGGLGTTGIACMLAKRNSISYEIDSDVTKTSLDNMNISLHTANEFIQARIKRHLNFINNLPEEKKEKCYHNTPHGFAVKTRQETAIEIEQLKSMIKTDTGYECDYTKLDLTDEPEQLSIPFAKLYA